MPPPLHAVQLSLPHPHRSRPARGCRRCARSESGKCEPRVTEVLTQLLCPIRESEEEEEDDDGWSSESGGDGEDEGEQGEYEQDEQDSQDSHHSHHSQASQIPS
jgi:hypothetical protein